MTSEVVLMNRRAIAMAADSATTTQYYDPNKQTWRTRYFKGANKIFNLSVAHPVGVMTYDSANIQGVPWEVIIKAYRDELGDKPLDHLAEYAEGLFTYIENNKELFPADHVRGCFLERAEQVATIFLAMAVGGDRFQKAKTAKEKKAAAAAALKQQRQMVANSDRIGNVSKEEVDEAVEELLDQLKATLAKDQLFQQYEKHVDVEGIAELGIRGYYAKDIPGHEKTGIVFTGFGDREYFPTVREVSG